MNSKPRLGDGKNIRKELELETIIQDFNEATVDACGGSVFITG